jgi:hypothetical protein
VPIDAEERAEMGRRVVTLLNTKKDDLSEDDYAAMRKGAGYVKRHPARGRRTTSPTRPGATH